MKALCIGGNHSGETHDINGDMIRISKTTNRGQFVTVYRREILFSDGRPHTFLIPDGMSIIDAIKEVV